MMRISSLKAKEDFPPLPPFQHSREKFRDKPHEKTQSLIEKTTHFIRNFTLGGGINLLKSSCFLGAACLLIEEEEVLKKLFEAPCPISPDKIIHVHIKKSIDIVFMGGIVPLIEEVFYRGIVQDVLLRQGLGFCLRKMGFDGIGMTVFQRAHGFSSGG